MPPIPFASYTVYLLMWCIPFPSLGSTPVIISFTVIFHIVPCTPLNAPNRGEMSCTGNVYEDICVFTCDDGYELTGSDTRTCQSDGSWSGSEAVCTLQGMYNEMYYQLWLKYQNSEANKFITTISCAQT